MTKEFRNSLDLQFREDSEKLIVEGYALVFDTPTLIGTEEPGKGFYEVIKRGAVSANSLKDVPLKYNHSKDVCILARTRNKSLELTIDDKGLFIRGHLQANVQQHIDVYNMVKAGLLDKMSFAFVCGEHVFERDGKIPTRIITKIDNIFDVSIVDAPAYDATEVHARSFLTELDNELKALDSESKTSTSDEELRKAVEIEKLKLSIKLNLK